MRIDTRIIEKPWGYEEILVEGVEYTAKFLVLNPQSRISLQYHTKKTETMRLLKGDAVIYIETNGSKRIERMREDKSYHIAPGVIHRLLSLEGGCTIVEVSTTFPDDTVRLADDYKRVG